MADAEALVNSGLADQMTRVLVEPVDVGRKDAVAVVTAIHRVLDRHDLAAPRLQHGDGETVWILLEDAAARGIDTRIGFEDTLLLPDGTRAASNAALVRAARKLGAGGCHRLVGAVRRLDHALLLARESRSRLQHMCPKRRSSGPPSRRITCLGRFASSRKAVVSRGEPR